MSFVPAALAIMFITFDASKTNSYALLSASCRLTLSQQSYRTSAPSNWHLATLTRTSLAYPHPAQERHKKDGSAARRGAPMRSSAPSTRPFRMRLDRQAWLCLQIFSCQQGSPNAGSKPGARWPGISAMAPMCAVSLRTIPATRWPTTCATSSSCSRRSRW